MQKTDDTNQLIGGAHELFAVYYDDNNRMVIDQPDPDTGELVPVPLSQLPIPKQLTGIGFAIRNAEVGRDQALDILKEQAGIIRQHMDRIKEQAARTIGQLTSMAAGLLKTLHDQGMAATDAKKRPRLVIAGCGSFATNTTVREGLDTSEYDKLAEDDQAAIALANTDFFVVEQIRIIKPDRAAILAHLRKGGSLKGFTRNAAEDHVVFKVEKGTGVPAIGVTPTEEQAGE